MKLVTFIFGGLLGSSSLFAADPLAGKWIWNAEKSQRPTIHYGIKDLGGNRFALTGSTGDPTDINADGATINSPYGGTVSFKKINDREWQMIRDSSDHMVRSYTLSADGKTLKLTDTFTPPGGGEATKTEFTYKRTSPGKGIVGEWQSTSSKVLSAGSTRDFIVEPYGDHGLSFISSSGKTRLDMNFDGKPYETRGEGTPEGLTTSGTRPDANSLKLEDRLHGKLQLQEEYTLSADGKTLTETDKFPDTGATFKNIFDRQ